MQLGGIGLSKARELKVGKGDRMEGADEHVNKA
jgi:hypothetical protein